MRKSTLILMAMSMLLSNAAIAKTPRYADGATRTEFGSNTAPPDTVQLIGPWGSLAPVNGEFEAMTTGWPAWNGWTHRDLTAGGSSHWYVNDYEALAGYYSAWCGDLSYSACAGIEADVEGGYGHDYDEYLVYYGEVPHPTGATNVTVSAMVNWDLEDGFDFARLGFREGDGTIDYLWTGTGSGSDQMFRTKTYGPNTYVGSDPSYICVVWNVTSDGSGDDEDCQDPSRGALQIDAVTVSYTNYRTDGTVGYVVDYTWGFEGTLGEWVAETSGGVGDFAQIKQALSGIDRATNNFSPQVCFIDDGNVVPGTGSTWCIDWCYGPEGHIVNTQGGMNGPQAHLHNVVESPVIAWPAGGYAGACFELDVYQHESMIDDYPGMLYTWGIRSTASNNPDDIYAEEFRDRGLAYYDEGYYRRGGEPHATDLMVQDPKYVQVQLGVWELGYLWGIDGNDGTPAPYFDNVSLKALRYEGPAMAALEMDLAQDAFPENGELYSGSAMHLNNVRFDMAANISPSAHLRNDPGDSIVVRIAAVNAGMSVITTGPNAPTLIWKLKPGPETNMDWREHRLEAGYSTGTDPLCGAIVGSPVVRNGLPVESEWAFDLPDEGFLFPGDVLHYYIRAAEGIGTTSYGEANLPADLTGFGDFDHPEVYDPSFVVHALPTLNSPTAGDQVRALFWNDQGDRGGREEWYEAFNNLGVVPGVDFDIFYTNAPTSGVGNGLGGRAVANQIAGYDLIMYSSGDLEMSTITAENFLQDPGDDVGVLETWLETTKVLFATGDGLATDLLWSGEGSFVTDWLGLEWINNSLYEAIYIGRPTVDAIVGNRIFETPQTWIANGDAGQLGKYNHFDTVLAGPGSEQLACFLDCTSSYSAATYYGEPNSRSVVVSMPYDLAHIWCRPSELGGPKADQPASLSIRTYLLRDVLAFAGIPIDPLAATGIDDVYLSLPFTAHASPNPFNPVTRIDFALPQSAHLSLKIYDLRGELVRTLIDEPHPAGADHVLWNGTDDMGRSVASGVYFYRLRTDDDERVGKLALIK